MSENTDQPNEQQMLEEAQANGLGATLKAYIKLSGPGWMQSAITLGGGSLAGALFLGVIGGYEMLWVQLVAMILGVIMLAAISYVTLSTSETPFNSIRNHINPVLAWGWLGASLMANMVWALPQYALGYGAIKNNIVGFEGDGLGHKLGITIVMLAVAIFVTFLYGKKGLGIKIYEWILKATVALIVLSFFGVVFKMAMTDGLPWGKIVSGFIPNPMHYFEPSSSMQAFLDQIQNPTAKAYWTTEVVKAQQSRLIAAASAAVGINMTFLLPYSLLNKRWNKSFRGLAIFDLSTGMVIPFVIAVSCVVIVATNAFHTKPYDGLFTNFEEYQKDNSIALAVNGESGKLGDFNKALDGRKAKEDIQGNVTNQEKMVASMLLPRGTGELSGALVPLVESDFIANKIFGLGVLAMAMSTISLLMLISGYVVCEAFGFPHGGIQHKIGTLCAATGILWPFLWTGTSKAYLAIPTSVFGYVLLPIAFLTFFMMMNSKKILGDALPKGGKRIAWNVLMGISLVVTGVAAGKTAWGKSMTIGDTNIPFGKYALIGGILAIILGFVYQAMRGDQVPAPSVTDSSDADTSSDADSDDGDS